MKRDFDEQGQKKGVAERPDEGRLSIFNQGHIFFLLCGGVFLFAALAGIMVFFLSVHGAEEVMVPDVQGKSLIPALIELQTKELDARVQLRYADIERGIILEQDPRAGTIVRAGRKVRLIISQGALLSKVDFYTGRKLDEVRAELAALFAAQDTPLLKIKEPILYQYSTEPVGVILEQDPSPGTGIAGQTLLSFIVSKGQESEYIEMPLLTGIPLSKAMELVNKSGIRWIIEQRPAQRGDTEDAVVAQEPVAGDAILANRIARITVAAPNPATIKPDEAAGLFEFTLPEAPYPMPTMLEAILPGGERRELASVQHSGGVFRWPYRLTKNTVLVLSLLGREVYRETVQ